MLQCFWREKRQGLLIAKRMTDARSDVEAQVDLISAGDSHVRITVQRIEKVVHVTVGVASAHPGGMFGVAAMTPSDFPIHRSLALILLDRFEEASYGACDGFWIEEPFNELECEVARVALLAELRRDAVPACDGGVGDGGLRTKPLCQSFIVRRLLDSLEKDIRREAEAAQERAVDTERTGQGQAIDEGELLGLGQANFRRETRQPAAAGELV